MGSEEQRVVRGGGEERVRTHCVKRSLLILVMYFIFVISRLSPHHVASNIESFLPYIILDKNYTQP
jgi:hypothetical protein